MNHRRSSSRLGEARAYHPRGRSIRERQSGATVSQDPFRPALRMFDDSETPEPVGRRTTRRTGGRNTAASTVATRSGATATRSSAGSRIPASRTSSDRGSTTGRTTGARRSTTAGRATTARTSGTRPTSSRSQTGRTRPRRQGVLRWLVRPRPRTDGPPPLANSRRRLRLATALALTVFSVIGMRLVELQLTDGPSAAAASLQSRLQTVTLPAARGTILDRNGAVLAHSVEARYVYADPTRIEDPEAVAAQLQPLLGIPASQLAERMRPTTRPDGTPSSFEWLARGVDVSTANQIAALGLEGIGIGQDERRLVPGNDLAANLIGFTGEDLSGLEGLEAAYDEVLRGIDGERVYERGEGEYYGGQPIPGGYYQETLPQPGSDLRLTIDMDVQYELQRMLAAHLRPVDATFGAAVLLDARTGEVLAMASYPGYNAADPTAFDARERQDVATRVVFDPGSVHKPIVFGAALQEGVIAPGDTLVINPTIRKGDQVFADTTWHPPGTELTLPAIMAFSSNVGTIMIADELGPEKLYEYQRAFGLGEPTGVGMPGEVAGQLLPPEEWYGSSYGSVPIGHSVDVTALQLAAVYGAIANDGVWVRPRLVQAVIRPDGTEEVTGPPDSRRVLSESNAAYLRELLEAVVTAPGATGRAAAVPDYRVAGKTGTGQLVVDGQYAPGEVASFVGMAPADHPRYVLAVVAHTPSGGGGAVAAPAFSDMMAFALTHYRVPPSPHEPPPVELYP